MTRALCALVLACCVGSLADCSGAQDKTQARLASITAGCEAELAEAGSPGDLAQMQAGCATALRLLDPTPGDAGK